MRRLLTSSVVLLSCGFAAGTEFVRDISWKQLEQTGQLLTGEVVQPTEAAAPAEALKIENRDDRPKTVQILVLGEPGIAKVRYAVQGCIRYENLAPGSYLEMWNYFSDGTAYFTRTLSSSGPMQSLSGTSGWRPFSLPFLSSDKTGTPNRLEINVVFTGPGTVSLGPLGVVEFDANEDPFAIPGAWWDERTAGWAGGVLGSALGCLGAVIGTLAGLGKARRFVLTLTVATIANGLVFLGAGIVALAIGQPYAVYYPLLLVGGIDILIFGPLWPCMRRAYEQRELSRMATMDLGDAAISRQ